MFIVSRDPARLPPRIDPHLPPPARGRFLKASFDDGSDISAREAMLHASFDAGVAFTRAGVGYVHAIAHQYGALFHTPHGVANAMVLPRVLERYVAGGVALDKFKRLAIAAGLGTEAEDAKQLAQRFVHAVCVRE